MSKFTTVWCDSPEGRVMILRETKSGAERRVPFSAMVAPLAKNGEKTLAEQFFSKLANDTSESLEARVTKITGGADRGETLRKLHEAEAEWHRERAEMERQLAELRAAAAGR